MIKSVKNIDLQALDLAIERAIFTKSFYQFVLKSFEVLNPGQRLVDNWHIEYLCNELQSEIERVIRGDPKEQDLIINIPPRSLKSFICSVCLPVWAWLINPAFKTISTSYSSHLSTEHNLASRRLVESFWFAELWDIRMASDQALKTNFETNYGGSRSCSSTGGTTTGRGANLIVIDDPANPTQAFSEVERLNANNYFNYTLSTRLNRPNIDLFLVVMQRLHQDDLTGHLMERDPNRWKLISLPAELAESLHPPELKDQYTGGLFFAERFTSKYLNEVKTSLGFIQYAGQFLQSPSPVEGSIIKPSWFKTIDFKELEGTPVIDFALDTAYTESQRNDPSAIMAYSQKGKSLYIHNVATVRKEFPDLCRYIQSFVQANGYSSESRVYIEPKASGLSIVQELRQKTGLNVIEDEAPKDSKVTRVYSITPFLEAGRCYLNKGGWNESFLHEVRLFPNGKHDDQIDVLCMAVKKVLNYSEKEYFVIVEDDEDAAPSWEEYIRTGWRF